MEPVIITVNHDAKRFIELCIKAVHLRTKLPYKHIIIDNGSKPDTINLLRTFSNKKWITLHERHIAKVASGHANSLDWILQNTKFDTVCLLDSDAYPVCNNWLNIMIDKMNKEKANVIGCSHFRDESLIHPSCMVFKYEAYLKARKPSFAINKSGKFNDTGMIVCQKIKDNGYKLVPINRLTEMQKLVMHRWCATRLETAKDNLDGRPKSEWLKETQEWFNNQLVRESLEHS